MAVIREAFADVAAVSRGGDEPPPGRNSLAVIATLPWRPSLSWRPRRRDGGEEAGVGGGERMEPSAVTHCGEVDGSLKVRCTGVHSA